MNFKKVTAFVLSLTTLGSFASLSAFAGEEDTGKKPTYDYVALGDSITAGFGLENGGNPANDRALVLSKELIADPVKEAYPAVFGTYLAEAGEKYGYDVTATNLATTAYLAEDVEKVIREDGTKGDVASYILGEGNDDVLLSYHSIYDEYLPEAEMVSIMLGGNDVIMGSLVPMLDNENPVLGAVGIGFALTLFGCDLTTSVGAAVARIEKEKDSIDSSDILEAFQYLAGVKIGAEEAVIASAENVKKVVEAVQEKNPDADIALLSMFNPYITQYNLGGAFRGVMKEVFKRAIEDAVDIDVEIEQPDDEIEIEIPDSDDLIETDEEFEQASEEADKDIKRLKYLFNFNNLLDEERVKSETEYLLQKLTNEVVFPFIYTAMGKSSAPQMDLLNEKLFEISEEKGVYFVDVSGITPELDSDPHPMAEGHKEIADIMWDNLQSCTRPAPTFEKQSLILGGEIGVNFYMDLSNLTDEEKQDSYVEFTVGDRTTVDNFDEKAKNQTGKYYGFTCRIPSVGMADDITAVFHYGKNKTVTKVYTAEEYLELFDESDPENLLNLIRSVNDYGYHAQQYLSKNATSPWTIGVEHQPMKKAFKESYSDDEVSEIMTAIEDKKIAKTLSKDIENVNYSLTLDSDTAINLFIKQSDNYDGSMLVFVDKVLVFPKRQSDGRYRLTISGISPQHLGDMHEVTILTKNGTSKVSVSALSYVYDCLDAPLNVEETNAMASVYNYYASTMAYLG